LRAGGLFILFLAFLASPALAKNAKKQAGLFVAWKEIPAAAQTTIQTAVAGGKVKETQKINSNGAIIYCAEVKGSDGQWSKVYTTEAGALMKVEPDNARNKRKHKPLFG
jgi:hypothetical protein